MEFITKPLYLLISFEGIDANLVDAYRIMGGYVTVVQDRCRQENDPFVDPQYFDTRGPAEEIVTIMEALTALKATDLEFGGRLEG